MSIARIVESLKELGLTATEAKAYLALLRQVDPATGYELAARSEVPRSAIYKVLHRLTDLGLVQATQQKPQRFTPLPADRLVALLRARFSQSLDDLEDGLKDLDTQAPQIETWTLQGYERMLEQARLIIDEAAETLHASLWAREADALQTALLGAQKRGVRLRLFSFNRLPAFPEAYAYGLEAGDLEPFWQHRIILIADRRVALVGGAEPKEANRAVVTEDESLVEVCISNLVLDLTLFKERTGTEVQGVISELTRPTPPLDELIKRRVS